MALLQSITGGLRGLFRKECAERELDEELRGYVEAAAEAKIRAGMSRDEALRAARLEMGSAEAVKENVRRAGWESVVESFWQDARFGARMLRKSPGFTVVAILTLALGIGANTAMFSVVDSVLLNPLPFGETERLVWAWGGYEGRRGAVSPPDFLDYRASNRSFDKLSAFTGGGAGDPENVIINGSAQQVLGARVSSGFFETFGAKPLLGRSFNAADEQVMFPAAIILSHRFWQQRFGAEPNILGRTINFAGANTTIIGVMPEGFEYPPQAEMWLPTPLLNSRFQQRPAHFLGVVGLLKPGVSLTQAQGDLDAIAVRLAEQYPSSNKGWNLQLQPMQEVIVGPVRTPLLLLFGSVVVVLLIACVNVASLLLARNSTRQREIAIRAALGAGSGRITRQLVTESVMLGLVGGTASLLLAGWGISLLRSFGPAEISRLDAIQLNGTVLAFTATVSIITGILFGCAPGLQARKTDVQVSLKEGGRSSDSRNSQRLRSALVVSEVTLSVALLIGAGLLLNSLWRLLRAGPGFDPTNVLTSRLIVPAKLYPETKDARRAAFVRELMEKIQTLPGVEAAGGTSELPLDGQNNSTYFTRSTTPPASPGDAHVVGARIISGDYFRAMRIPLLQGRSFSDQDQPDSRPVMIVDEPFVRQHFPDENPISKHVLVYEGAPGFVQREIIGVVGGTRHLALRNLAEPAMYIPYSQFRDYALDIVVRSAADLQPPVSGIRAALASMDPEASLSPFRTMQEVVFVSVAGHRFQTLLLGLFGVIALLLAAAGIYGLISYSVAQRTHEIGIRLALGEPPHAVLRWVLLRGMKLVVVGMVFGLALAAGLTRLMSNQLYGVDAMDPATFVAAIFVLGLVALLACYIPARRATKVDPMTALRYE